METTAPLEVGQAVPDLVLSDDQGDDVALRDLAGSRVVLYFYPKDDTPGCTTQACELRDSWSEFSAVEDLVIYGVSTDDAKRHQRFRAKYDLPFHLLVDAEHQLADAFGFWVRKQHYGRTYWGMERSTAIIGPDGRVEAIGRRIQPARHADWLRRELGIA